MNKRKPPQGGPGVFLRTGQAARHCQVSTPTVKRWIREGRLRAFKTPGRHTRIELAEFQRFLKQYGMPAYPGREPEPRVLIVDDEPDVVELLVDVLAGDPRGFKIETAMDGYEALIKVGAFKPSVLILDIVMPRLDGVEVCRRLKAGPDTRGIRILGITGYPDTIPRLLQAGADACLTKPLDVQELRRQVDRFLARP
ncbi:MAG: response regulator [Candidatus Rokubacteria bacterium]|nr:response regulator [Candidatus Rokubacteria bacterium]